MTTDRNQLFLAILVSAFGCTKTPDSNSTESAFSESHGVVRDDDGALGQFVTAAVSGVGTVTGELVATYDHTNWMVDPSPSLTCALFTPASGLMFITPCDLRFMTLVERPIGFVSYRDSLWNAHIRIETPPLNGAFYVLTGNAGLHRTENGMSNFAWDLVRANADRTTHRIDADGSMNENYLVWNDTIQLPVDGTLFEVEDGIPDNVPCNGRSPDVLCTNRAKLDGNKVGVQVGPSLFLYFLHIRQGTIPFLPCHPFVDCPQQGVFLPRGTVLGRVGNSGLSVEPHLHMSLLFDDTASGRSWGVPIEFHNTFTKDNPAHTASFREFSRPEPHVWVCQPDSTGVPCLP